MKTRKTRHQLYLPGPLSERFEALAARPGASKTSIMTEALSAWLDRQGAHELDQRFGMRLDALSRSSARLERKVDFLTEALALFVRHHLTLTAHTPAFDEETRRLGLLRYEEFVRRVGQMAAGPHRDKGALRQNGRESADGE